MAGWLSRTTRHATILGPADTYKQIRPPRHAQGGARERDALPQGSHMLTGGSGLPFVHGATLE